MPLDLEDQLAYPDFKVTEDFREMPDCRDFLDRRATMASLELDYLDRPDLKVFLECQEPQEYQESQVYLDSMDSQDDLVHQG